MQPMQPSVTAERAAAMRAVHQRVDQPAILDDPLAARLVGEEAVAAVLASPELLALPVVRALRASIAIRGRYAEDCVREAVGRGVRQLVVLGAGLDSFAYRHPFEADGLRVYEVDHPATQQWKRARLADAGITPPPSLTFVPIDFERQTLGGAMAAGGFDSGRPAFVSWLGVTVYLSREAVLETLAWVATLAAGSEIVCSYVRPPAPHAALVEAGFSRIAEYTALLGEPWRTFFEPPALAREVERLGLVVVENLAPEDAAERYCRGRRDGLRPGSTACLLRARVAERRG